MIGLYLNSVFANNEYQVRVISFRKNKGGFMGTNVLRYMDLFVTKG